MTESPTSPIVVVSGLDVPLPGAQQLEDAFSHRLHAVDDWPGHRSLEVWRDLGRPGRYVMTSWWDDRRTYARYMRSPEHHASHGRVPDGPNAPNLAWLSRYEVIAR